MHFLFLFADHVRHVQSSVQRHDRATEGQIRSRGAGRAETAGGEEEEEGEDGGDGEDQEQQRRIVGET